MTLLDEEYPGIDEIYNEDDNFIDEDEDDDSQYNKDDDQAYQVLEKYSPDQLLDIIKFYNLQ